MALNAIQQELLRRLPGVDHILGLALNRPLLGGAPKTLLVHSIRAEIEHLRQTIRDPQTQVLAEDLSERQVLARVELAVVEAMAPKLRRAINATGVVIHTNLGRSLLAEEAVANLLGIAGGYSNLEYDLASGRRGSRYSCVEDLLCEITGAQAALVVNNNAGAVLLCLESLAKGKGAIVSRGELVEIGGSFRIPDVMARSGAVLVEVGTTNRTHRRDYETAIDQDTGLLLKVHQSNYSVVGFTTGVSLAQLVELGRMRQLSVMEDLGSGTFIDFSRYGLIKEPTVQESVATGADVVTFSGDKLLGGPQAGIIVGKRAIIDRIKKNPVHRALRIDKLTLAALESTLRLYRKPENAVKAIPTLRMLTLPREHVARGARTLARMIAAIDKRIRVSVVDATSRAGGGSLPLLKLPTHCVAVEIEDFSAHAIETYLRRQTPPIIGRIEAERFLMDPRTLQDGEFAMISRAFEQFLNKPHDRSDQ